MQKQLVLVLFSLLSALCAISQPYKLEGTIVNALTGAPIVDVNLKIPDTRFGTATNTEGRFELIFSVLPAVVEVTCIGYEPLNLEITKVIVVPMVLKMQPAINELEGLTITDQKAIPVYRDPDYSVFDYEMMGDKLLVLIFKYQFKRSELLLLTRWGDTLAKTPLPDLPPLKLYKDPLGNVHYFSKNGNAYQCYFDGYSKQLLFINKFDAETVLRTFANYQFVMNKRLFFQEKTPSGFSSQLGFIDNENGKKYLQTADNSKAAKSYYSDLKAFTEPRRPDDIYLAETNARAFELFYKPKSDACMVQAGPNRIAVFDFTNDTLQVLNSDWQILSATGFNFHKEVKATLMASLVNAFSSSQWKWRSTMYTDNYTGRVYTSFERKGRTKLSRIDLYTGLIDGSYELPVLFAEKIIIYKGEAFFRYKPTGEAEKWRLYKMKL